MALPSNWATLTSSKQLFVYANLERTSRGEPPISYLVKTYDHQVQTAVLNDTDPNPGRIGHSWGSIWAGGSTLTVLESFDLWMYYDGPGGDNIDCTGATTPGCWGHRDIILSNAVVVGDPTEMDAVAGTDTSGIASIASLFVTDSSAPATQTVSFTWSAEQAYLVAPKTTTTTTVASSANPSTYGESVTFTATVVPTDGGGSVRFSGPTGAPITGCAAQPLAQVSGSTYQATCQTAALPEGADGISTDYSGDTTYAASSGALSGAQTVSPSPLPAVVSISPDTGTTAGGSTVVIVGERFTGTTSVTFGTAAAKFRVTGPTKITAVSPPGTGTMLVVVTTTYGASPSTSAGRFTYVDSTPTITELDFQPIGTSGAAWVPVDGRDDYCRRVGVGPNLVSSYLACSPFNGTSFGDEVVSGIQDWGYTVAAQWVPTATGADYCRRVGDGPNFGSSYLACTVFNGTSFGDEVVSGIQRWGYTVAAQWVPTAAGADYCRRIGNGPNLVSSFLSCTAFNGTSFGDQVVSGVQDWGYTTAAQWVSVDGRVDYCRRVGNGPNLVSSYLACTPFNGTSFGNEVGSGIQDWGYPTAAQWVTTATGVDYCRRVGNGPNLVSSYLACTAFNGTSFGHEVASGVQDWGYPVAAQWVPKATGADYCRRVGNGPNLVSSYLACTAFNGTSFGHAVASGIQDWGYTARWEWLPGPGGTVDYCRPIGSSYTTYLACTPIDGAEFGSTVVSASEDQGL